MNDCTGDVIKQELKQLIQQANAQGKWLHCHYQDIWLSPAELAAQNAEGKLLWSAINWTLRDPNNKLEQLKRAVVVAIEEKQRFIERMKS